MNKPKYHALINPKYHDLINGISWDSTCAIGYLLPSNRIKAVYCHWDGSPKTKFPELRKYDSIKKVRQLVRGGAMYSLETTDIWDSEEEREPQPLYCQERTGELIYDPKIIKAFTNKNLEETKDFWKSWNCEYLYVFFNNKWFYYPLEDI